MKKCVIGLRNATQLEIEALKRKYPNGLHKTHKENEGQWYNGVFYTSKPTPKAKKILRPKRGLEVILFNLENVDKILKWASKLEFYKKEGLVLVDNGYAKSGTYLIKTTAGSVYRIERDLLKDLEKNGCKLNYL